MLTIIEGLDGVGKTTLARSYASASNTRIMRFNQDELYTELTDFGVPINTWVEDVILLQAWSRLGFDAILDRSIISGLVYHDAPMEVWAWASALLSSQRENVRVVFLDAITPKCVERDPEWAGRECELNAIRERFHVKVNRLAQMGVPCKFIDTGYMTPDQVYMEFANSWEHSLRRWRG